MPPVKVVIRIRNKVLDKINEKADLGCINYIENGKSILYSYIDSNLLNLSMLDYEQSRLLCDAYLNHCFDFLGSGLVRVDYNINPAGVEGIKYDMSPKVTKFDSEGGWLRNILLPSHVNHAKTIWRRIGEDYIPIDWQMDFKSGFRYSQKVWYKKQPIGKPSGADIKVPWEISRMQHLTQLAIFAFVLPGKRDEIIREFKNEVYDFAATNPVSMGANWTCTMDVGIRAANMLIAHDILKRIDENDILDDDFESFFGEFIYGHGEFIVKNLEWNDGDNNNHYLSDICGLLFVSAYLERNEVVDTWLAFSMQEIINCMERQFYDDGGNFEASTSYHRLSGELMVYSTALIYGLLKTNKAQALKNYNNKLVKRLLRYDEQEYDLDNGLFFPEWYIDKLFKAGCFTADIIKPNGNIPQVGDNDSGRFFKFSPIGCLISVNDAETKYYNLNGMNERNKNFEVYYDENILDHSAFISAVDGLFDYRGFYSFSSYYPLEKSIIESLSGGFKIKKEHIANNIKVFDINISDFQYKKVTEIIYEDYVDEKVDIDDIKFIPYPDFGLYIFKGSKFYLSIFGGGIGQNGIGGHSHNDKLSFELNLCGKDIFVDPGTYLYTPIPQKRELFRNIKAHNVPIVNDEEQNKLISLFEVKDETACHVLDYGRDHIKLYLTYRNIKIVREFIIYSDKLVINDSCNKDFYANLNNGEFYSNGYGKLLKRQ